MIYIADISGCTQEQLLPHVCEFRRTYAAKYKQEADRIRSLGAAVLLDHVAEKAGIGTEHPLRILHDEAGRPYLADHTDWYVSISHAGDYVAAAVDRLPVGIDIEKIRPCKDSIAKRCFTQEEQSYLADAAKTVEQIPAPDRKNAPSLQDKSFTQIWTLKESFLKAIGTGLRLETDSFSVILTEQDPERMRAILNEEEPGGACIVPYRQDHDPNTYLGKGYRAPAGYVLSACFTKESSLVEGGELHEIRLSALLP